MSKAEITGCKIQAETEAETLAECDQRARERFQMLDAMEAQDEKNTAV